MAVARRWGALASPIIQLKKRPCDPRFSAAAMTSPSGFTLPVLMVAQRPRAAVQPWWLAGSAAGRWISSTAGIASIRRGCGLCPSKGRRPLGGGTALGISTRANPARGLNLHRDLAILGVGGAWPAAKAAPPDRAQASGLRRRQAKAVGARGEYRLGGLAKEAVPELCSPKLARQLLDVNLRRSGPTARGLRLTDHLSPGAAGSRAHQQRGLRCGGWAGP